MAFEKMKRMTPLEQAERSKRIHYANLDKIAAENDGVIPSSKSERTDGPTFTGPRGGRYRINSNGRKSYDVP